MPSQEVEPRKIKNLRIAILGTRGIPNNYGGFEQFAEYLSVGLSDRGHDVTVFNSKEHPFEADQFKGVKIIKKYCPESKLGSFAHFIYDWVCARHVSKENFDIIYNAGYGSAAPSIWFYSKKCKSIWVTNMDGLEWKREKWSSPIKWLTKKMEALAVKHSNNLISDNIGIQTYLKNFYNAESKFLAYGAEVNKNVSDEFLKLFKLKKKDYYLIVARLEPENSVEMILDGYVESDSKIQFIVVGNYKTRYGRYLKSKFAHNDKIRFIGGIYEKEKIDSIRKYASLYFHGHTVGGTNPSLLEAMGLGCDIIARDNEFNRTVLKDGGRYFTSSSDIKNYIKLSKNYFGEECRIRCVDLINKNYNWELIIDKHEQYFLKLTTCR